MSTGLQLELGLQSTYPCFAVRTGFMVFRDHLARYCNVNPCDMLVLWISLADSHELKALCNHIAAREQYFTNAPHMQGASNALGLWEDLLKDRRSSTPYAMPPTPRPKCIPLPPEELLSTPRPAGDDRPDARPCAPVETELPWTPRLGLSQLSPNWRARRD